MAYPEEAADHVEPGNLAKKLPPEEICKHRRSPRLRSATARISYYECGGEGRRKAEGSEEDDERFWRSRSRGSRKRRKETTERRESRLRAVRERARTRRRNETAEERQSRLDAEAIRTRTLRRLESGAQRERRRGSVRERVRRHRQNLAEEQRRAIREREALRQRARRAGKPLSRLRLERLLKDLEDSDDDSWPARSSEENRDYLATTDDWLRETAAEDRSFVFTDDSGFMDDTSVFEPEISLISDPKCETIKLTEDSSGENRADARKKRRRPRKKTM